MPTVVEVAAPPVEVAGLVVDVKRDGQLRARMAQLGGAWHLDILGPDWTANCADVIDAYEEYRRACRVAGVPTDSDDVLTVIEVYRPVPVEHGRTGKHRAKRTLLAQVVQQEDNSWMLSVFSPNWNRPCPTVRDALEAFIAHAEPHPQRGPVGGR